MASSTFTKEQKKAMLVVIAILAVLRFAGAPIVQWQQEQRQELQMVTSQLERAERLLDQSIDIDIINNAQMTFEELRDRAQQHTSSGDFRLQSQRLVETFANQESVSLQLFDWLSSVETTDGFLRTHQARVVIEGPAENMVRFQLALLQENVGFRLREMNLQPQRRGTRARSQNQPMRATLLIEVTGVQL